MSELKVKDKEIVSPGEVLASGMDFLPAGGTFREGNDIISSQVGIVNISGRLIKIIPLSGKYVPRRDDVVIGKIVDLWLGGWRVDIGWAYSANLSLKDASEDFIEKKADLSQYFNHGDIILTKITDVNSTKIIDLSMKGQGLRKLIGGRIIEITPSKVPRVIGKQGSMINLIKEKTDCKIFVGQNGRVWIKGIDPKKELTAVEAIRKINEESSTEGLTDKIKEFLEAKLK
jgi:exosome complex component RRP4